MHDRGAIPRFIADSAFYTHNCALALLMKAGMQLRKKEVLCGNALSIITEADNKLLGLTGEHYAFMIQKD